MIQPLRAFVGEPLQIICVSTIESPDRISIIESTSTVKKRLTKRTNDTHAIFTLNPTIKEDNGRRVACAIAEIVADPAVIEIFCKVFCYLHICYYYDAAFFRF